VNKRIYQACFFSAVLACAGVATAADKVDYVDLAKGDGINITDGKIFINPVNGNYGQASSSTMTYHLKAKAGCNGQNVVKEFFVSLGGENVSKEALEYSDNYRQTVQGQAYSKSLPWSEVVMKVPLTKLGFNPAEMCQNNLNQKVSQGATKQQVLAKDQVLSKGVWFTSVARCGKIGKSNDQYGSKFIGAELKVICKSGSAGGINDIQVKPSSPVPAGNALQAQFQVTNATFKATPKEINTSCPAKAKFTGTISASGPGTVQYQVSFPGSDKSGIRNLHFAKAGTKSIGIIEYQTNSSLPVATATLNVLSPGSKKAHAHFKVQCITQGAGGVGNIQMQPSQNNTPKPGKIKAAPTPAIKSIKAKPAPTLQLQINEKETDEPARRLPSRSTEDEQN
jgi:hypothetical protein